jgi:hypothetical protein
MVTSEQQGISPQLKCSVNRQQYINAEGTDYKKEKCCCIKAGEYGEVHENYKKKNNIGKGDSQSIINRPGR